MEEYFDLDGEVQCVSPRDVADYLGISLRSLRKMRDEGSGPSFISFGTFIRYDLHHLEFWLTQHSTYYRPSHSDRVSVPFGSTKQ